MNICIKQMTSDEAYIYKSEISAFIYESIVMCNFEENYQKQQAEESSAKLYDYLLADKAIVLGAFDRDTMVGFLWAYAYPFREDINRLYISIIHVNENYRNRHIGERLIKEIEKIAEEKKFDAIFLHAEATNEKVCRFYEKLNYARERIQYVRRAEKSYYKAKEIADATILGGGYWKEHLVYSKNISHSSLNYIIGMTKRIVM